MFNNLASEIDKAISYANRYTFEAELSGENPDEAYKAIEDIFESAIVRINELKNHRCEYNADDYCDICGRDGLS